MKSRLLEVTEWEWLAFRGQAWNLSRLLAGDLRFQTRYHGWLVPSRPDTQSDGLGQGWVQSPKKFSVATHPLLLDLSRAGLGVPVLGRKVLGVTWSDDFVFPMLESQVQATLEAVPGPMGKHCFQVQQSKVFLLPMFRNAKAWAGGTPVYSPPISRADPASLVSRWRVTDSKHLLDGKALEVRQAGTLLGRLLGPAIDRHPQQAMWAAAKGKKALRVLSRMGAFSAQAAPDLAETLYIYFVQSVIVSAVLNTVLTAADLQLIRTPQAIAARKAVWAGQRVSQQVILRELGWEPIEYPILRSKLGLFEAIRALPRREYARHVLDARMLDVAMRQGGKGLCGETFAFWSKLQSVQHWQEAGTIGRAPRVRKIRAAVSRMQELEWEEWCSSSSAQNGDYAALAPPAGEAATHLQWGSKLEIGLMVTMRAGACALRGNKVGMSGNSDPAEWLCRLCPSGQRENEHHLLLACPFYSGPRVLMQQRLSRAWSRAQCVVYASSSPRERKMLLLGRRFPPQVACLPEAARRCDEAVKAFLREADALRVQAGCQSLTARHADIETCSEAFADECAREAEAAEDALSL